MNEEGIGSGPSKEFITMLSHQLQRRELHLWNESDQTPYPITSVVRMMNYPLRGPEEGVVSELKNYHHSGAFLRCFKCACLNTACCPHHDCLLSVDRKESSSRKGI